MDVLLILSKWCAVQKSQQTLKNGANGFDGYFSDNIPIGVIPSNMMMKERSTATLPHTPK